MCFSLYKAVKWKSLNNNKRERKNTFSMCDKKKVAKHVKHDARSFFFSFLNSRPSTSTSLFHFVFFGFFLPLGCYRVKFFFLLFCRFGRVAYLLSQRKSFFFLFISFWFYCVSSFFFLFLLPRKFVIEILSRFLLKVGTKNRAGSFFFWEGNQSCAFACFVFLSFEFQMNFHGHL